MPCQHGNSEVRVGHTPLWISIHSGGSGLVYAPSARKQEGGLTDMPCQHENSEVRVGHMPLWISINTMYQKDICLSGACRSVDTDVKGSNTDWLSAKQDPASVGTTNARGQMTKCASSIHHSIDDLSSRG
eukprot:1142646-Pelagomonas_calceolata.AAC.6